MAETLEDVSPKRTEWLPVEKAEEGFLPGEMAVQFNIRGKQFVTFVPSSFVDLGRNALVVLVIGRWDDGSYLVELPGETTGGGSKLRVPEGLLIGK